MYRFILIFSILFISSAFAQTEVPIKLKSESEPKLESVWQCGCYANGATESLCKEQVEILGDGHPSCPNANYEYDTNRYSKKSVQSLSCQGFDSVNFLVPGEIKNCKKVTK